ncbi:MAG: MFS transporter [archaeon]|nr:MFS transporter [archaeon]
MLCFLVLLTWGNTHSTLLFTQQEIFFVIGCILMCFGNGFFKPNISSLVKHLYNKDDARIDSAYTLFYMEINVGALLAPIVTGIIVGEGHPEYYGWAFIVSGIVLIIGLVIFPFN